MTRETRMKPCPFCESSFHANINWTKCDEGFAYYGECSACGTRGPAILDAGSASAIKQAIKAWNKMPRSGDGIALPKGTDGEPIKPGDTVWVKGTGAKMRVNNMWLDKALHWSMRIGRHDEGWQEGTLIGAKALTKTKPDTWEDLVADMRGLVDDWDLLDDPKAESRDIIKRIRQLAGAGQ